MFRHNTQHPKNKKYDICVDDYINKPFTPEDYYSETDREIVVTSTNYSKNALANLSEALSKMKSKKGISNEESDIQPQNQFNSIPKSSLPFKPPIVYNNSINNNNKASLGSLQNLLLPKIKEQTRKKNHINKNQSNQDITPAALKTSTSTIEYNNRLDTLSLIKNTDNIQFVYPVLVKKKERLKNTPKNEDHSKKPVNTEILNKRYSKSKLPILPETLNIGSGNTVSLIPANSNNSSLSLKVIPKFPINQGLIPQKVEYKPYENIQSKTIFFSNLINYI